nr:MAG TPA: hypothetical protein [Caudoviricetes sp.]
MLMVRVILEIVLVAILLQSIWQDWHDNER